MSAIALEAESARVKELVDQARQTGEVLLTEGSQPVAKIVRLTPPSDAVPQFGFAKGAFEIREDFDEPLDELFEVLKE